MTSRFDFQLFNYVQYQLVFDYFVELMNWECNFWLTEYLVINTCENQIFNTLNFRQSIISLSSKTQDPHRREFKKLLS